MVSANIASFLPVASVAYLQGVAGLHDSSGH